MNRTKISVICAAAAFAFTTLIHAEPLVKPGETIAFLGDSITQAGNAAPGGYIRLVESGLAANGIEVSVILMTPNRLSPSTDAWREERLARYAEAVRGVAKEKRTQLVDVWQAWSDHESKGGSRADFLLDSAHPNDEGHALVAGLLTPVIADLAKQRKPAQDTSAPPGEEDYVVVEKGEPKRANTRWKVSEGFVSGSGQDALTADLGLGEGDFRITARLRMLGQKNSAASFFLDSNHFGFEGARGTIYCNAEIFDGKKLLQPAPEVFEREVVGRL